MARTIEMTIGFVSPLRSTVIVIGVLGLPRIILMASVSVMPLTAFLLSLIIRSPAFTPALNAGVSSIGEITLTNPLSIVTSIPRPPNSP